MTDPGQLDRIEANVKLIHEQIAWIIARVTALTEVATAMQGGLAGRLSGARNAKT